MTYENSSLRGYDGFYDNKTELDTDDDAAFISSNGRWRIPTKTEWQELEENCVLNWAQMKGVNGYQVIASNGNMIFLPATGRYYLGINGSKSSTGEYWSSTTNEYDNPYTIYFSKSTARNINGGSRYYGEAIRPVLVKNKE